MNQTATPSPCINVCQMRPAVGAQPSMCSGCFRNIDEIVAWGQMSDASKQAVWRHLPSRGMPRQRLVDAGIAT
jgi:uncharacterized protein